MKHVLRGLVVIGLLLALLASRSSAQQTDRSEMNVG
jgi:hypothetical protein